MIPRCLGTLRRPRLTHAGQLGCEVEGGGDTGRSGWHGARAALAGPDTKPGPAPRPSSHAVFPLGLCFFLLSSASF